MIEYYAEQYLLSKQQY